MTDSDLVVDFSTTCPDLTNDDEMTLIPAGATRFMTYTTTDYAVVDGHLVIKWRRWDNDNVYGLKTIVIAYNQ
jgi:hypothetical protein